MPKFAYVAVTPDGQQVKGRTRATSRGDAEVALYGQDLRDLRVKEKKSILKYEISGPRIKRADVMHLSRQIAAFLRAGLPILEAVHTIGAESESSSVRRMMNDIEDGLRTGERFSDCLERYPKVFPGFYRGIVRSAELTGELDTVLAQLAIYIERDLEARRKIKSALIYPTAVAIMSIVTVGDPRGLRAPEVRGVLRGPRRRAAAADPDAAGRHRLPRRLVVGAGRAAFGVVLAARVPDHPVPLAASTRGTRSSSRSPCSARRSATRLVERFCRVLSSMVGAGVNLTEALAVTTEALRNRVFIKRLGEVSDAMLEGEGISGPLARTRLFPGTATQMLRVGEETGSLDDQLRVTAEYYEVELDYKIKKLTSIFEPLVIIVMGGIVGFVAIALVSAMYGIFNQVDV